MENDMQKDITDIKVTVQEIKTTLELQQIPIEKELKQHDRRISSLESNQRWVALAVIGACIAAMMSIILK